MEKESFSFSSSLFGGSSKEQEFLDETALLQRNDQWSVGMLILSTLIPDFVWWNFVPGQRIVRQALEQAGLPSQLDEEGYIIFEDDDEENAFYENSKFAQVLEAVSPITWPLLKPPSKRPLGIPMTRKTRRGRGVI